MSNTLVAIADEVVTLIQGGDYALDIESVERCYVPEEDPEEESLLKIYVIPGNVTGERSSRRAWKYEHTVSVVIVQRLDAIDNESVDPLMEFSEAVSDVVRDEVLTLTGYVNTAIESTYFDFDKLKDLQKYMSLHVLTFEGDRDV